MFMRLENPVDGERILFDVLDNGIGRRRRSAPGRGVIIEHRVNDGGTAIRWIANDVSDRIRRLVEERFYIGSGHYGYRS